MAYRTFSKQMQINPRLAVMIHIQLPIEYSSDVEVWLFDPETMEMVSVEKVKRSDIE